MHFPHEKSPPRRVVGGVLQSVKRHDNGAPASPGERVAGGSLPSRVAEFFPDGEGVPRIELTSGSTKSEKMPPHPFAPGAAKVPLPRLPPSIVTRVNSSLKKISPTEPFSAPLVPVVKSIWIGAELEPM